MSFFREVVPYRARRKARRTTQVGTRSEFVRQTFRAPKVLGNAAIELLASVQVYCFKLSMGLERKRALLYEADKPRIMHISKLVKTLSPYGPETPTLAGCDKVLV